LTQDKVWGEMDDPVGMVEFAAFAAIPWRQPPRQE